MSETPKQAASRLAGSALARGFKPEALHCYTDEHGAPLYWRIRAKHPTTGEKWIRPMRSNGDGYEMGEPSFPNGKPLYRLHQLAEKKSAAVYIVEGEKCADKLSALGLLATTSGGATSANTVNAEVLRGRTIRIWPDNDEAGRKFAADWAAILSGLGCAFHVVDVDVLALPEGGDCVDWLAAHPSAGSAMVDALSLSPRPDISLNPSETGIETGYSSGRYVTLTSAADIEPEAIEWLWDGWLASGKFHLLGGAPGTGKTTLAIAMAATVSCGGRWPDGTTSDAGNVLIWSGEDDPANTLVPRLILSGGNRECVHFVMGTEGIGGKLPFDPAQDMQRLAEEAKRIGNVRLLIVDPIVSAVAGNSHNNAETRRSLQPLVDLGAALNCAVLGITHFTKGTGGSDPVERVTGSIAFAALARVVLVAAKKRDPEEGEATRMLARAKSNIGQDSGGFSYELMQGELPERRDVIASFVVWGDALEGSAREMLATAEMADDDEGGGALSDAKEFLADILGDGAIPVKEIKKAAIEAGVSDATLRRAKSALKVKAVKAGMLGGWCWRIERRCSPNTEDAHTQSMSTFAKSEHLRQPIEVL
ncbi:MAG: AAA family ATPase [Burkholderiales bacterium]